MKPRETQIMPTDGQASERIAEFERLLAAALRRILAETAPDAGTERTRISTPGRRADPTGEEL